MLLQHRYGNNMPFLGKTKSTCSGESILIAAHDVADYLDIVLSYKERFGSRAQKLLEEKIRVVLRKGSPID